MNKSRLSKKNQEKVSKICQECGRCCRNQNTAWFGYYSIRADWWRWASDRVVFQTIQSLISRSIERVRENERRAKKGYSRNLDCGCLDRDSGGGNAITYYCIIERKLGYKYKPHTCRHYECFDKLGGVVKP